MMVGNFCSKCGAPLEQDSKFCGSCGAKLEHVEQQAPVAQNEGIQQIKQEFTTMTNNVTEQFSNATHDGGLQKFRENSFFQNTKEKYFTTHGRLNRWAYFVKGVKLFFMSLIPYILMGISVAMMEARSDFANVLGLILILPSIALVLPFVVASIMLEIRRCHDLGHSGWLILIGFIPYINIIFWLYILFCPGTKGDNQYGPDPLQ